MSTLVDVVQGLRIVAPTLEAYADQLQSMASGEGAFPLASTFRLSMRNLDKAWYEATRRFGPYDYHPARCEDWNLESGGDSDLGEPLVAPFSGVALSAHNWAGTTGRVVQLLGVTPGGEMVVWAGWHLQETRVVTGQIVIVGQEIGTIGNADGKYAAHLHEQICIVGASGIPAPFTFVSDGRYAWVQPSVFYAEHGVDAELVARVTAFDGK